MKTLLSAVALTTCLLFSSCKEEATQTYDFRLTEVAGTAADQETISNYVFEKNNCINGNRMLENDEQAQKLFVGETAKLVEEELHGLPLTDEAGFEYSVLRQANPSNSTDNTSVLLDSYSFEK